jgi:hypothetical protein
MANIEIAHVEIAASHGTLGALHDFYSDRFGLPVHSSDTATLTLEIGGSRLQFREVAGNEEPFYHFAFLVPGNRFDAAYAWLKSRTDPLSRCDSSVDVFEFDFWDARACYFHDPAENIVELIAHQGLAHSGDAEGTFKASELLGISEIGLVTPDMPAAAKSLDRIGLPLWSGSVRDDKGLGFVGRKAHTLILSAPGRGWLPTGRPAEVHPVDVRLRGPHPGEVDIPRTPHRVRTSHGE